MQPSLVELKSLVDVYNSDYEDTEKSEVLNKDPMLPKSEEKDEQQLERRRSRTVRAVWPADAHVQKQIMRLHALLDDPLSPHEAVYAAYRALPDLRLPFLEDADIRRLFHHLAVVEHKNESTMLRYLSLMDDLTAAGIPATRNEWNSAIAFSGRWVRRVKEEQVETAMQIWLRMEREAGISGDNVTLNILFDVATKAGKYALAEVILKEMRERRLVFNRYLRTGIIFYHGAKRDGDGVRRSYKELVDAGEIVDTAVLNCVIAGLIKSGEASAAEHIFERMKQMSAEKTGARLPPVGWRASRDLSILLDRAAMSLRDQPAERVPVQDASPIGPNLHTYRLLIRYHALESGNIDRIIALLAEMKSLGMQLHGSVFYHIFSGFVMHGGIRYSSWTKLRLDRFWIIFLGFVEQFKHVNEGSLEGVSEEDRGCYLDSGVVTALLKAYAKCGNKDVLEQVWEEALDRWKPSEVDLETVTALYATLNPPDGFL